jgi:hypothetical protein
VEEFGFLVMTNTWTIGGAGRRVHLLAKVPMARLLGIDALLAFIKTPNRQLQRLLD